MDKPAQPDEVLDALHDVWLTQPRAAKLAVIHAALLAAESRGREQGIGEAARRVTELEEALRSLLAGFDHVRSCRECGESDVVACAEYEPDAAAAVEARRKTEGMLAFGNASPQPPPIDMVLRCPNPKCGLQHIDAPEPGTDWTNPPHRSHKCHECGLVWRPADVPTNGVAAIATRGKADTWPPKETKP